MGRITSYQKPDERYLTLRIVGFICTALGTILLLAGTGLLAFGLYNLLSAGTPVEVPKDVVPFAVKRAGAAPIPPGLSGLLTGVLPAVWSVGFFVMGLQFLAMGALFRLAIHVEENTRVAAKCLEKLATRLPAREGTVDPLFRS
jgi:hypothetical protein